MAAAAATILDDLYRYNDWANAKIVKLADGLSDAQLDQPCEMGFGSLRAILFHLLQAERIWLERWEGKSWRPLETDPRGASLAPIAAGLIEVSEARRALLDAEIYDDFNRIVTYQDSRKNEYRHPLRDLLLHVANHGIHHRAQLLYCLKQFDRRVPAGIDYLFYKLAYPSVEQDPAAVDALRQYGMEAAVGTSSVLAFDLKLLQRYYSYHDWANRQVVDIALTLDDATLDQDHQMGLGSIRKNLLHLHDVEPWWLATWTDGPTEFPRTPVATPLREVVDSWRAIAEKRNLFVASLNEEKAARVVAMTAFGPPKKFRVLESMIQICGHGTHHRAQLVNMLRRSGITPPALDFIVFVRATE